jgi:hypothetical protein
MDCSDKKSGGRGEPFDFVQKAYSIEATLTTSSVVSGSVAGIEMIQLRATTGLPG